MAVGFVRIETPNNFPYIFGLKCNCRQTFISEVAWTGWKFTIINNKGTLFSKLLKSLAFSLKSIMKRFSRDNGSISGIFLLFKNVFSNDQ